ncbi:MAG: DUF1194 domain-containing protein [Alphaproteobacteria bacterium]|nr:DUF1194 domain-containing protein [Alphaproteobacteria bacterium]
MPFRYWLVSVVILIAAPVDAEQRKTPPGNEVDLQLVLAVDVSGSVDDQEAILQRSGYIAAITDPAVIKAITSGILGRIAVTYFEWAGEGWHEPVTGWRVIDDAKSATNYAALLRKTSPGKGPWTSISDAIDHGVALIENSPFKGLRKVIDISGDGPNNTGGLVVPARDAAIAKRITINGLPIINERLNFGRTPMANLDLYYRHCVIGGPRAFMIVANGFKDFARAVKRKLILEIADNTRAIDPIRSSGLAQTGNRSSGSRWIPPCDAGEKRFRGIIDDE